MLLWRLFVTSLVVLRGTTPRGVSLTRLGKVTPSNGFGRPSRQMSEFENGLVVPENATSEQLRELPLRSSLRVTPSHGFLQTCRQLSNLEYPLVMAPNAMSDEMFPKKIQPLLIWKRFSKSLVVEKQIAPRNLVRCLSDAAWQGHSFQWFYDTPSPNVKVMTQKANSHDCFQKERFQTMLLWKLFATSLVVSMETTPRSVSLTRLGKVTPSMVLEDPVVKCQVLKKKTW